MQFGRRDIVGLDIGTYAVKLVQMRKSAKGWFVTAGAIVEIGASDSDVPSQHEANITRAILTALRLAGVNTSYAVCALGGNEIAIRNFDFPPLPDDELDTAVLLEARQVCPFTTTDIAVDYHLIPNGSDRSRGYLVAATNKQIKNVTRIAKKARLNCVMMDADALALLNCFLEIERPGPDHGTAILNIGNNHTTMVIEGKGGWPFVRNLNYAAEEVIKKISDEHNVAPASLHKMLMDETNEIPSEIYESLMKETEEFVRDIEKTLLYYSTQENSFSIQKVLVCGGASMYQEIVKLLGNMLPVETVLWNPFEKMKCQWNKNTKGILLKNVLKKNGPAMVVAAGLALRSI
ncbi:MAG: pilus assembly protein PilM [Sedimentisphaerales bacterium]|nr:pilus assembly protein PilM [Sedimentisphaerales bacterium]